MPRGRDLSWSNLRNVASSRLGSHGKQNNNESDSTNLTPNTSADAALTELQSDGAKSTIEPATVSKSLEPSAPSNTNCLAVPASDSQASFASVQTASSSSSTSSLGATRPARTGLTASQQSQTLALLRIQIVRATNLMPKDRNGKADPFICVALPGLASLAAGNAATKGQDPQELYRRQTTVVPKTLDPEWKDAVWDFEVTNDWFGPAGWQEDADEEADEVEGIHPEADAATAIADEVRHHDEALSNVVASALSVNDVAAAQTSTSASSTSASRRRPTSRRTLSATASKVLSTSAKGMRLLPKGAAAGARAVARGAPRPMRLRRNNAATRRLRRSSAGLVSNLEIVVWDKDFARREYMGEVSWPVWEWCRGGRKVKWQSDTLQAKAEDRTTWLRLLSSRQSAKVSGQVQVRIGFVPVAGSPVKSLDKLYRGLVASALNAGSRLSSAVGLTAQTGEVAAPGIPIANDEEIRAGIRAIPASQSVGTGEQFYADNGFSSDEDDEDQEELLESSSDEDDEDDDLSLSGSETDTDDPLSSTGEEDYPSSMNGTEAESEADVITRHRSRVRGATSEGPQTTTKLDSSMSGDTSSSSSGSPGSGHTPEASADDISISRRRKLFKKFPIRRSTGSGQSAALDSDGLSGYATSIQDAATAAAASEDLSGTGKLAKKMPRRRRHGRGSRIDSTVVGTARETENQQERKLRQMQRRLARCEKNHENHEKRREIQEARQDYNFKSGSDIIGIVMMEVKGARDLPRWRNSMRTGFDMDPFTIVAFGQKIFRTRVLRHTLNPVWDEKLLFHVRQHEGKYMVKMSIYDWDKISANDHVGSCEIPVATLMEAAPKPEAETGLYSGKDDGLYQLQTFDLSLNRAERDKDVKYGESSPKLTISAKFTPYAALRQRFWRQLCQQFDTNDSNALSILELTSMLDFLGSTLTPETITSFFVRYGKSAETDEITIDEAIIALENETRKSSKDKRTTTASGMATAVLPASASSEVDQRVTSKQHEADHATMDVSGPKTSAPVIVVEPEEDLVQAAPMPGPTRAIDSSSSDKKKEAYTKPAELVRPYMERSWSMASSTVSAEEAPTVERPIVERVILLKSCPLCHMPRLSKKGDGDVVTHLAVCASQDWRRVDSMVVGNFVTASQAHRKWFNKIVITATQGRYKLGVNSANIIVQDRETGELLEEKMQVYVRLGIRLLYQGARSRMEGARVRKMLKNMSLKQGKKYDSSSSAREIPGFIAFHNLNVDEIRDPLDSFKTFNEFFYRKLKADARPVNEPTNSARLVSAADCRLMVFSNIDQATTVWVKGREFSVERLLGSALQQAVGKDEAYEYTNGSLCIFRLAPQDYHRFHCPADAVVGKPHAIEGAYYTVNPMAIRSAIDVYGENVRVIVPFRSPTFGTFFAVNVGAMMVGSVKITVSEGQTVKRGDEMGYYAFGGSTTILVFKRGTVTWDDDIMCNSTASIETLVKQGTGIGRATASVSGD